MLKKIIVYMIISALAFSLLNILVKNLNHLTVYQIVFFRSIGTLLFTVPFLLRKKIAMSGNKKTLLFLRGIIGVISMTLFFMSLKYLATGSAVTIRYISPIFAAIFAVFLLKERIKHIQWLFFVIAFCGVFILKGFDAESSNIGILYAICSAVFSGLVFIIIRKIGNQDHPIVIVNYFMIIAAIAGGLLSIQNWIPPLGYDWLFLLSLGIFGYFGQYYMTKAFQSKETNIVAPLKYIEVIFTILIGVIWLNETYSFWSIFGIIMIVFGLIMNLLLTKSKS